MKIILNSSDKPTEFTNPAVSAPPKKSNVSNKAQRYKKYLKYENYKPILYFTFFSNLVGMLPIKYNIIH